MSRRIWMSPGPTLRDMRVAAQSSLLPGEEVIVAGHATVGISPRWFLLFGAAAIAPFLVFFRGFDRPLIWLTLLPPVVLSIITPRIWRSALVAVTTERLLVVSGSGRFFVWSKPALIPYWRDRIEPMGWRSGRRHATLTLRLPDAGAGKVRRFYFDNITQFHESRAIRDLLEPGRWDT